MLEREIKNGRTELLTLSVLESRPRHGHEIRQLVERLSGGFLKLHVASLYPLPYRMEDRGWIQGRWVEKAGERRRHFYRITSKGREVLAGQRDTREQFTAAVNRVIGVEHA
jgi:DNA-binding PadR family transcriptional regulator